MKAGTVPLICSECAQAPGLQMLEFSLTQSRQSRSRHGQKPRSASTDSEQFRNEAYFHEHLKILPRENAKKKSFLNGLMAVGILFLMSSALPLHPSLNLMALPFGK